jgi:Putative prokaryotic signal transducing protein
MITLATFQLAEDAHLFRSYLESQGIQGFLENENISQLFWQYSAASGGVRMTVAEEDLEAAALLYQEYMAGLRAGPDTVRPVRAWPLVLLLSMVVGYPLMIFGRRALKEESSDGDKSSDQI